LNEINELIKRAKKYLNSAELLLENEDFDSSVSRSYYAMFFATEAVLLTKQLEFSSHKGVISAFSQHFVKTGIFSQEMAIWLKNAFKKRQTGDYSFYSQLDNTTAQVILKQANNFVTQICEYLKMIQ